MVHGHEMDFHLLANALGVPPLVLLVPEAPRQGDVGMLVAALVLRAMLAWIVLPPAGGAV